ncbi:MAG TPA: CHRD domain-containing protein [Verrucomicrobiae bacterium]|nr:CHRD domain-containing protein [Verrucomicrobiae bacterium]
MKKSMLLLLASVVLSQAADFDLSPPGTDRDVGLSSANEVPAVTNSAGSGNEISGGITFDPTNGVLTLAVGYGSAAGFSNLTGAATSAHLHGPATTGTTANVVVDLAPYVFPANDPAQGGVIFGSIALSTNVVADLMAGLLYLNIHTATNADGEIRGQLIPVPALETNTPPTLICPTSSVVQCSNKTITLVARVADPDGDALSVVWTVNGAPIQTNQVPASSDTNPPVKVKLAAIFPLGTNVVDVSVSDSAGNTVSCTSTLTVIDTLPPLISATASPNRIWPPNHKMVEVKLKVTVKDQCGPGTWKIVSVSSNEPVNGLGDGDTGPDWEIVNDHCVRVRAERSGRGNGRVYTIKVQAQDSAGNSGKICSVTVVVPKSQGK